MVDGSLQVPVEFLDVHAPCPGFLHGYLSRFRQIGQVRIHALHPKLFSGLYKIIDLVGLPLPDQVADGVRFYHNLQGGDPSVPVHQGQKLLCHHAL